MDRNTTLWCGWAVRQTLKRKDGSTISANVYHPGYVNPNTLYLFHAYAFIIASDTGYMTPRGPCPVFKGIIHSNIRMYPLNRLISCIQKLVNV